MDHLDTLNLRLSNERARLANAKTDDERAQRQVWIVQMEWEVASEEAFIGADMTDAELLKALES